MQNLLQIGSYALFTNERLIAIAAALIGLVSIIIARQALSRAARNINSRSRAIVSLVAGLTAILAGVLHLANTTGGFGTGKGRAGAIVALLIGIAGVILSGLALVRSRRIARNEHAT